MASILFAAKTSKEGKVVDHSNGQQRILVVVKDNGNYYGLIHDVSTGKMYLNRIKTLILMNPYVSENFEYIDNDEEWDSIMEFLNSKGLGV